VPNYKGKENHHKNTARNQNESHDGVELAELLFAIALLSSSFIFHW
jgi:hypothetical protein